MSTNKNESNSKKNMIICGIISAVVAVIAIVAVLFVLNTNSQKPVGTVQFNTNPSVSMVINSSDRVIEVQCLNQDAEILLSKTDLVGKNINEASRLFVKICSESGYIDATKDSLGDKVEIIITNNSEKKVESLGKKLCDTMNAYFDENGIIAGATYLKLDDIKESANAMGVSANKYILVKTAQKMHVDYSEEELVAMSEEDILKAIKEKTNDMRDVSQEYYDQFNAIVAEAVDELEVVVYNVINPFISVIKTLNPDFQLDLSIDMTFADLKKQITANITSETLVETINASLDAFEKTFNETKEAIQKAVAQAQDKIIEDSKLVFENAKKALEGRLANYKQDVEMTKTYYQDHKEEIDEKIKQFREGISVDIDTNFKQK